ncbi:MAG: UvrB/UvrC motif-containing protein [Pirellulales bacterium]
MSQDLSNLLDAWPYNPEDWTVRLIHGDDGREKIQMRLDLGVLQMQMDGRPDGQRPNGCESWLHFYQQRQRESGDAATDQAEFRLDSRDCQILLREGNQYYYRYRCFWSLKRYELCARDTLRNLRLFTFVRQYAAQQADKLRFDQWRPYVTMMHARAVATPLLEAGDVVGAIGVIDHGIQGIQDFLEEYSQTQRAEDCQDLLFLQRWREEVAERSPSGRRAAKVAALHEQLNTAVAEERFEEAAHLRDELRKLQPPSAGDSPAESA